MHTSASLTELWNLVIYISSTLLKLSRNCDAEPSSGAKKQRTGISYNKFKSEIRKQKWKSFYPSLLEHVIIFILSASEQVSCPKHSNKHAPTLQEMLDKFSLYINSVQCQWGSYSNSKIEILIGEVKRPLWSIQYYQGPRSYRSSTDSRSASCLRNIRDK